MSDGSSGPTVTLHTHSMPGAPHLHGFSAALESHGRSGWALQTHPVSSQLEHFAVMYNAPGLHGQLEGFRVIASHARSQRRPMFSQSASVSFLPEAIRATCLAFEAFRYSIENNMALTTASSSGWVRRYCFARRTRNFLWSQPHTAAPISVRAAITAAIRPSPTSGAAGESPNKKGSSELF